MKDDEDEWLLFVNVKVSSTRELYDMTLHCKMKYTTKCYYCVASKNAVVSWKLPKKITHENMMWKNTKKYYVFYSGVWQTNLHVF